jgi:hypothetical protein
MSRLPHFLDNWLTDGGEAVGIMRRSRFTLQDGSWCSFLLQAEQIPDTLLVIQIMAG